ncbi:LysE family translocator [uncultured Devosia sp.]|uniref:LysE family translocator n=1 Tax=uncultured Devosia sp. TaxID=211434 RepID=UPI0026272A8B|nr:LysE family translocator [uncultured Devosia sp.]
MIPTETLLGFMGAATLLAWVPGPDNLFVLTQSALSGRKVGLSVTIGLCIGLIVHTIAVSLGVAAIFQTSQAAFDLLKYIGAAYLMYLAYRAIMEKPTRISGTEDGQKPLRHMIVRGILMNLTNPKVAIFFLAFLPQFTSPERGNITIQMLLLGLTFVICAFASFGLITILAGTLSHWVRTSTRVQLWLNRTAALVFATLALRLAFSNQ